MSTIYEVFAREVLDSRGNPTVEAEVVLESADGASNRPLRRIHRREGSPRAKRRRQKRYKGKGVRTAVKNVNEIIAHKIEGLDVAEQALIDNPMIELDCTENKSKLGANAILAVSMAVARAAADFGHAPVPVSWRGARTRTAGAHDECDQRWSPRPEPPRHPGIHDRARRRDSFTEALRMGVEVFHALKAVLKEKGHVSGVGDEGGFAPR